MLMNNELNEHINTDERNSTLHQNNMNNLM